MEGLDDGRTLRNEAAIKVDQADKFPQLALCCWLGKIPDHLDLLLEWSYPSRIDMMTKDVQLCHSKVTLGNINY